MKKFEVIEAMVTSGDFLNIKKEGKLVDIESANTYESPVKRRRLWRDKQDETRARGQGAGEVRQLRVGGPGQLRHHLAGQGHVAQAPEGLQCQGGEEQGSQSRV